MPLREILARTPKEPDRLIGILLELQAENDRTFVSEEEAREIARHLGVTESRVCAVLSFYSFFSQAPRGKHVIRVCKDVPCHVRDDFDVLRTIEELLGVKAGQTTANGKFTVETSSCLGCCDRGPAMRIDGELHAGLTAEKVRAILADIRG
ncbi:MAG: NAD(P)H-dependent oxidoreductase subunit E [Candidatus Izemoplasmatales bacterium]